MCRAVGGVGLVGWMKLRLSGWDGMETRMKRGVRGRGRANADQGARRYNDTTTHAQKHTLPDADPAHSLMAFKLMKSKRGS